MTIGHKAFGIGTMSSTDARLFEKTNLKRVNIGSFKLQEYYNMDKEAIMEHYRRKAEDEIHSTRHRDWWFEA